MNDNKIYFRNRGNFAQAAKIAGFCPTGLLPAHHNIHTFKRHVVPRAPQTLFFKCSQTNPSWHGKLVKYV